MGLLSILLAAHLAMAHNETAPAEQIPQGLVNFSDDFHFSPMAFIVDKSKRLLKVYKNVDGKIQLLSEHPADIGKKNGDKVRQNDHRTPVGIYFLLQEMRAPTIPFDLYGDLAFTTDYPNIFDKRDQKTGHGIWLHAVPDTVPLTRGSRGCVVVRNDVIKSLAPMVQVGETPILIYDEVSYLKPTEHETQKKIFLNHFENWRTAWEQQDVNTYIKFYDSSFKNDEMDYDRWYEHKKKLKNLYKYIKVSLSSPLILINKEQVVIRALQKYESDLHQDYGVKTIHAHFSKDVGFRIIREDWRPVTEARQSQR